MSNRYTEGGTWDPNRPSRRDTELNPVTENNEMAIELCKMQINALAKRIAQLKGQPEWLAAVPIRGINLRAEGGYALVEIETIDGATLLAIKEHMEGPFGHHISASGIRSLPSEPAG